MFIDPWKVWQTVLVGYVKNEFRWSLSLYNLA